MAPHVRKRREGPWSLRPGPRSPASAGVPSSTRPPRLQGRTGRQPDPRAIEGLASDTRQPLAVSAVGGMLLRRYGCPRSFPAATVNRNTRPAPARPTRRPRPRRVPGSGLAGEETEQPGTGGQPRDATAPNRDLRVSHHGFCSSTFKGPTHPRWSRPSSTGSLLTAHPELADMFGRLRLSGRLTVRPESAIRAKHLAATLAGRSRSVTAVSRREAPSGRPSQPPCS
jgi:hypothetical protein